MDSRLIDSSSMDFDFQFWSKMLSVNTAIPAIVDEFDPSTMRLKVTPAINTKQIDINGVVKYITPVQIVDVPLAVQRSTGLNLWITCPISKGDICTLIFSQRSIDEFLKGVKNANPDDGYNSSGTHLRTFNINDAMVFPGIVTTDLPKNGYDNTGIEIKNDPKNDSVKQFKIHLSNNKIELTNGVGLFTMTDGKLVINAPNGIEINANITQVGNTTQTGDVTLTGNTTQTGDVMLTGKATCTDTITAAVNVIGGGISLNSHIHGGVASGTSKTTSPE